jgi:hypothetical protein
MTKIVGTGPNQVVVESEGYRTVTPASEGQLGEDGQKFRDLVDKAKQNRTEAAKAGWGEAVKSENKRKNDGGQSHGA